MKDRWAPSRETVPAVLRRIEKIAEPPSEGLRTGLKDFDRITGGIPRGGLAVVAGGVGSCKRLFAINVALKTLFNKERPQGVAMFSLRESAESVAEHFISAAAQIDLFALRTGIFRKRLWPEIATAGERLARTPLYIDDTPHLCLDDAVVRSQNLAAEMKGRRESLGLIVLNYLQSIRSLSEGNLANRPDEVEKAAWALKNLAANTRAGVLVLSSIVETVEWPDLDARIMGRAADLLILLRRSSSPQEIEKLEIVVAKNQKATGIITARFVSTKSSIEDG